MKRWGMDRGPGWWMLLLGSASMAVNWGPGGFGVTAWWLRRRTRRPDAVLRSMQGGRQQF